MLRTGHKELPYCANKEYNKFNPYCKQCGFSYQCSMLMLDNAERYIQDDTERKNQILCKMLYNTSLK